MDDNSAWTVYILLCSDDTLYTGITNNMEKRLRAHNSGAGAKYTRSRRPVKVVYTESCYDRSEALRREFSVKKMSRSEKLDLIGTDISL